MFNKDKFSEILYRIYKSYDNQRDFAKKTGVNRSYLSRYINQKIDSPPKPGILKRIASNSFGITSYMELMQVCGYLREDYNYEVNLMFDKEKFSKILRKINCKYDSIRDFSKVSGFNRTSLSEYIRCEVRNPPSSMTLRKIANCSYGITTYVELLLVCGYLTEEDIIEINSNKVEDDNKLCVDLEISNLRIPNFEETEEKVKNLVSLLERADELIKSLSKK